MSTTLVGSTAHGTASGNYNGITTSFSSDPAKADGYYGYTDGLHTVAVVTNSFVGTISIQGTLVENPEDTDWFDISNQTYGDNSSALSLSEVSNFTGNFVHVRASITNFTAGSITSIQFNY